MSVCAVNLSSLKICSETIFSLENVVFFLALNISLLWIWLKVPPKTIGFPLKDIRIFLLARNISLLRIWLKGTSQDNWISVGSFPRSPPSLGADNCMLCSSRKWFGPNLYVRSQNYFLCIICSEISAIFMQSCLLWIFLYFLHRFVEVSSPRNNCLKEFKMMMVV